MERESNREPKYFSKGVISEDAIHIIGTGRCRYGEFFEITIKKIDNKWICRGVCDFAFFEEELNRKYFKYNNIQNIGDLLQCLLKATPEPCMEIVKNNKKTVETIDNIFRDLYYSGESNTEASPDNN